MKSQQAVAIRFVGRRVIDSTCLFFVFDALDHIDKIALRSRAFAPAFDQAALPF